MRTISVDTSLRGLTVLVTNATTPIGSAIVRALSNRAAWTVIHFDQDEDQAKALLENIGGRGWIVQADLSTAEGVMELWGRKEAVDDRIYAVVNNVCVRTGSDISDRAPTWYGAWERDLFTNLMAPAMLARIAAVEFGTYRDGRIINVISPAGQQGKDPHLLSYEASEAALIAMTRSMARDHGADGISAVAITTSLMDLNAATEAVGEAALAEVVERVMICLEPDREWMNGATFDCG